MPSLMDLSLEIQEMVVLQLESVEDVVSLGSSCSSLTRLVGQTRLWRVLLARTELVEGDEPRAIPGKCCIRTSGKIMTERVQTITTFLNSLANRDAIFSVLHWQIFERYPATYGKSDCKKGCVAVDMGMDCTSVTFPSCPQLHTVSAYGLELLALTGLLQGAKIHKIKLGDISPSLVIALASLEGEKISELEVGVGGVNCFTEEEGLTLASLLERCSTWRVNSLSLYGEVGGQTWERLGRALQSGHHSECFLVIRTDSELVMRGRREDLLACWQNSYRIIIYEEDEEEEVDWKRIEEIIQ